MGWNRSDETQKTIGKQRTSKPAWLKGAVTGTVVILGVIIFLAHLQKSMTPGPKKEAERESNLCGTPEPIRTSVKENKSSAKNVISPQKVGETRDGYILLGSGKLHKVNGVLTNNLQHTKSKYSIFKHKGENEISRLIFLKPGNSLVGTPDYGEAFKNDLIQSLDERIVVLPEDSDEVRTIKQAVIDAKSNLKVAYEKGEDVVQIIIDTRKECQDLARYKRMLTESVIKSMADDPNPDADVYIEAANKMLESKGIAPMRLGPISKIKFLMKE